MNKLSLDSGRVNQKLNTRNSLLLAARSLMRKKQKVSLEDVAGKAGVSRATIYRYYPNIELLLIEASLDFHFKGPGELTESAADLDLKERVFFIQDYYNDLSQKHELVFRRYLSAVLNASITAKKKIRGARRVHTLTQALEPFKGQLKGEDFSNFVNIATLLMGIEAQIVAKDVCQLNNKETLDTLHWGMDKLLKGVLG